MSVEIIELHMLSLYHVEDGVIKGTLFGASSSTEVFRPNEETLERKPGTYLLDRYIGEIEIEDKYTDGEIVCYVPHGETVVLEERDI